MPGSPDELYVYRPGGTLSETGNLDGSFNAEYGNTIFNESTDPNPFLYNGGTGGAGGLSLSTFSGRRKHFFQCDFRYSRNIC